MSPAPWATPGVDLWCGAVLVSMDLPSYWVYVLRSSLDGELYVGQTSDLERRMAEHEAGEVPSTHYRRPLSLLYVEGHSRRADAVRR